MTSRYPLIMMALAGQLWLAGAADPPAPAAAPGNASGWRLLFDGQSTRGWRGFKKPAFPDRGWSVADGCLKHARGGGGGDIITEEEFGDFDLEFEWKLGPGANSGVKYFITEQRSGPIGHEYQIIDDDREPDARNGRHHQTASFYDVVAPGDDLKPNPPGQWNRSRILVRGRHVEHWLNGRKALEYELESDALRAAIAKSKFKEVAGFDAPLRGHILLQDHGGEVWFRNLRVREPAAQ